jgi:uncharacterized protein YegP (UPF0339 family)
MAATKKVLNVYRTENEPHEWRWTLTRAGKIIASSSEGYKRRDGAEANILSALGLNLDAARWDSDDRIVKQGTVKRAFAAADGKRPPFTVETIHVTIWKKL